MVGTVILLSLLSSLVTCSGEGNIRILEDEIAVALRACTYPNDNTNQKEVNKKRQRRSENLDDVSPKIDDNTKQFNHYNQEKRNSDRRDQIHVLHATDYNNEGYGSGNVGERLLTSVPKSAISGSGNGHRSAANTDKTKRSDPLLNTADTDQV
ncbi:unnamed protein product [Arctia plantaginis]|uniref:Uncharacterized protein n=1 Tax=Arctia plantaginis TaxID=874455 RepID=A0A8S0ZPD7_ARCPL|nr:unnamed protein product [Arctia plantaginis]